jgi:L-threonylcarbamoyladenylate synthase
MKTIITEANKKSIEEASMIIKNGGLVAFPTETVYGLGADALNSNAVKKIYLAKGRPSDNPLIVHISNIKFLEQIICFEDKCDDRKKKLVNRLIKNFWPGPLTIIFYKRDIIPYQTSGNLETVAVRMPSNNIARELINLSNTPIAAPSANISGRPSCTRSSHVIEDLNGKVDMILCSDKTSCGLESTVIDITGEEVILLRPGIITHSELENTIDQKVIIAHHLNNSDVVKSPGMKYKHYAPQGNLFVVCGVIDRVVNKINELVKKNNCVGVLATDQTKELYKNCLVISLGNRNDLKSISENLFDRLREFDLHKIKIIYAEGFIKKEIGFAIMDRLLRASENHVIYV